MKAVVKLLTPKEGQRVIAISDIHGNLTLFQKLLEKIGFCKDDLLILLGDMLEKGPRNLDTLHYIMELEQTHQVYPLLGNCDTVLLSLTKPQENERLRNYLMRKRSTIHEMYEQVGKQVDETTDMLELKEVLCRYYFRELEWLRDLPHIIVAGNYYFAHAALKSENMSENSMQDVINEEAFLKKEHSFSHTVVVGHMPVMLYDDKIYRCNPIFDRRKNIISIDGGNIIKVDGQLNALIINDVNSDQVSYESMDLLPKAIALTSREPRKDQDSINVCWSDGAVKVLEKGKEFSYCRHCSSGHELWILNDFLSEEYGQTWADEGTDYILTVRQGEMMSVVKETSRGYLVKKDGIVGWYDGALQWLS